MADKETNSFNLDNFLFVNPDVIKKQTLKWLANRQAQKRFTKDVDIMVMKKDKTLSLSATKKLLDLSKKLNLNKEIFYKTEVELSYNDGKTDKAYCFWIIDIVGNEPKVTLITSKDIINTTIAFGQVTGFTALRKTIKVDGVEYKVLETRTQNEITRELKTQDDKTIGVDELSDWATNKDIDEEALKQIEEALTPDTEEWKLTDLPSYVELSNDPYAESDSANISEELDELVVIKQKKRDELLINSTKLINVSNASSSKKKAETNGKAKAEKMQKKMAAASIIMAPDNFIEGQPSTTVASALPQISAYDNAERTVLNTILKKTGGATDVDSKGTVQQSKGEILMSQGDEYKVSQWKANDRQNNIQKLFEIIWKVYTTYSIDTITFKDVDGLYVILSKEEVLSEREKLENLKIAQELGLPPALLISRLLNINILEAAKLKDLAIPVEEANNGEQL